MHIIVLTNRLAGSRRFYLAKWLVCVLILGLGAIGVASGVRLSVYALDRQQEVLAGWAVGDRGDTNTAILAELARHREEVLAYRQRAYARLDAASVRLGALQAQTLRLEALGSRLADMAGLDSEEFALDAPIGLGGPQQVSALRREHGSFDKLLMEIDTLERRLQDREAALHAMEELLMEHDVHHRSTPQGMPVKNGWISSAYGYRPDPFTGRREFHRGVDISAAWRSQVYALAAGVVVYSAYRSRYGNIVELDHGEGYKTRYSHNYKNLVEVGQWVRKGEPIALIGSTGRSTGAHVHFEVLEDGRPVNPSDYISLK